ncbi:hypothetical protein [Streptomyces sp. CAU 1734]|uniref:hypothetical protein n=1 Tax=Streptomyces sp. CAU 1734 TaxID=3140360 RepID=UPI003260E8A2
MERFINALAGFPTVLFTAALVVVVVFWLLVVIGAAEHDGFDADVNAGAFGLGGVPVSVAGSLLIAIAWFLSLTGSLLLPDGGRSATGHLLGALLLPTALWCSLRATRLIIRPLAKLFPDEPGPSRQDFIGQTCVIRTGRVDGVFGQAEVRARDGSAAVVQVRRSESDAALALGGTGLLYAYDEAGEFFWVAPFDTALDPTA